MFQPKGFMTDRSPRDFDGQRQGGASIPAPILVNPNINFDNAERLCCRFHVDYDQPVALINDNSKKDFKMYRIGSRTDSQNPLNQDRLEYAVIDKDLYSPELNSTDSTPYKNLLTNDPDFSGAIGAIISTDVLCLRIKDKKEIIGRDGLTRKCHQHMTLWYLLPSLLNLVRRNVSMLTKIQKWI